MRSTFYRIHCITNLHMGSGDINFNVIDNEVERDPVNNWPVMFSSGVKGAMRDHFRDLGADRSVIGEIFGSDINRGLQDNSFPGKICFLTAYILLLPFRAAAGKYPYYLVTTKSVLQQFGSLYKNIKGTEPIQGFDKAVSGLNENSSYGVETDPVKLDDYLYYNVQSLPEPVRNVTDWFADQGSAGRVIIIPDRDFGGDNNRVVLPVLARNTLDDQGISNNLWYEEVVPHETVFYLPVISNGTADGDRTLERFHSFITAEGNCLVQFGGNATIGYGLTRVSALQQREVACT